MTQLSCDLGPRCCQILSYLLLSASTFRQIILYRTSCEPADGFGIVRSTPVLCLHTTPYRLLLSSVYPYLWQPPSQLSCLLLYLLIDPPLAGLW